MELLKAVLESHRPPRLVYVSGGQALSPLDETEEQVLNNVALSNGYCQTKTVSELLVKDFMRDARYAPGLSIVKPSYIIGSPQSGVANTTDFLWRLVGSCIDIKAYPAVDEDDWLYISDVDQVASIIIDNCCASTGAITKILDGIRVKEFWAILIRDFGYDIQPLGQDAWLEQIHQDIVRKREGHRLWPLLDTLEDGKGRIGVSGIEQETEGRDTTRVEKAIRKNVEYLIGIEFFPQPEGEIFAGSSVVDGESKHDGLDATDGVVNGGHDGRSRCDEVRIPM